jgi:large subunit ribosomal protein L4
MASNKVTSKKSPAKSASKTPTKVEAKETPMKKTVVKKDNAALTIDVHNLDGKVTSSLSLPEIIFGTPTNKELIAQAVRVHLANQRRGTQSTKTRGEVQGSTRKIYKQKGTGRARHGGVRAPIFVHGGIAHGPKPRDFSLTMPQKMKQKALSSVLSTKLSEKGITVLTGLTEIKPKTKEFTDTLKKLSLKKRTFLVVTSEHNDNILRAARNIKGVTLTPATLVTTYDVIQHQQVIFMKEAIEALHKRFLGGKNHA